MGLRGLFGKVAKFYETDRRRQVRVPAVFSATLSAGVLQSDAQGIDLHKAGMKVRCDTSFDVDTKVFVRILGHRLIGFGVVRHCSEQADGSYLVGMHFQEPLTKEQRQEY